MISFAESFQSKSKIITRRMFVLSSLKVIVFAAIISRFVLLNSDLSPFQTTQIRLIGAIIFLLPITICQMPNKKQIIHESIILDKNS